VVLRVTLVTKTKAAKIPRALGLVNVKCALQVNT
jgi:hypothetical protein